MFSIPMNMGSSSSRANQVRYTVCFNGWESLRRTALSRAFGVVYACGIVALFYHHVQTLVASKTTLSSSVAVSLFVSDLILAFLWVTSQLFYVNLIRRFEFPENLKKVVKTCDFPALDVFVCTADPYKEPPMIVVNTALSVMAYEYPTDKISVYVSDDGGSALTLFALVEAAKFATHWLPFCRENSLMDRCPEAYFASNPSGNQNIKMMYEKMKKKIEDVVERGEVGNDVVQQLEALKQWTDEFNPGNHPPVIQVLLDNNNDRDVSGCLLPTLTYVCRQKKTSFPHHFKAGALNTLLRVSASMSNASIILTLDCDMYSNDPHTPIRALCYLLDPNMNSNLAYVQFPQIFPKLNPYDIYACEFKRLFQINPMGFNNSIGPNYVGTGCFFNRRAFFSTPSSFLSPSPELPHPHPTHVLDKPIKADEILARALLVAACDYETDTQWGYQIGFRYGSLVEDFYTGYRMQCEGWRSVFCNPKTAAFHGDAPITLVDALSQTKRWAFGLLQVGFCKYSPLTFGIRKMGLLMGLCYSHYTFWPLWAIPLTVYAFLPPLALLNELPIFPKILEIWFALYVLLFVGAYAQDFMESALEGGSFRRWWNEQRMWMIRGVSCWLFGLAEFTLKSFGIFKHGFSLTHKLLHSDQVKKYDEQIFDLGISSPLFVPLTTAAIINLFAFIIGFIRLNFLNEELVMQMLTTGFVVINCLPIYSAVVFWSDKGAKISTNTILLATFLASALSAISSLFLN